MLIFLSICLLLLSLLVLILVIKSNWNSIITILLIPLLLFNIGFSWHTIDELWGQAKNAKPTPGVELLYASIRQPWIYLVVHDSKDDEPKFHKIPYSKENEKSVAKAMKRMKQGQRILIKDKKVGQEIDKSLIEFYVWDHINTLPKN